MARTSPQSETLFALRQANRHLRRLLNAAEKRIAAGVLARPGEAGRIAAVQARVRGLERELAALDEQART